MIRFAGCFIYLADLCFKIAYFRNTKWISEQIRELWYRIFMARIAFVIVYHILFIIFSFGRSYYEYSKESKASQY